MNNEHVSIGDWILTFILTAIPFVGIVMLFVWAFGGSASESKQNYAKATLILAGIVIGLNILLFLLGAGMMFSSLAILM